MNTSKLWYWSRDSTPIVRQLGPPNSSLQEWDLLSPGLQRREPCDFGNVLPIKSNSGASIFIGH